MEQLKDDSIAGTSDENPKEDGSSEGADQHSWVGQPQCVIKEEVINNEYDFPEKVPTSWKEANKEERTFVVTFGESGKKYLVEGRLTDSLLSALKSNKHVCHWMEKNKTKEFHLIEKREPLKVCVNMGMPLKYVSEGSQFEMKSYKLTNNELWYRQYDNRKEECIVFYVCGTGSRMESHGAQSRRLMKNQNLLKEYCTFCIFAPKGESIKDALCNDGRFLPLLKENNWTLVKDGTVRENNFLVNNLSDQVYEIEVESNKGVKYSADQKKKWNDLDLQQLSTPEKPQPQLDFEEGQLSASKKQQPESDFEEGQLSTSKKQQLQDFEWQILQLYPKLKEERQNIDKFLRGYKKDPLEVYKINFGKEVNDSFPFKVMKTLAQSGDSVGYIEWRDVNLGCVKGSATCFVLHGRYILTCHHVINMIVGEGIEAKDWGDRIKQSARVTFSYVEQHPTENWFSLENWFEIADVDLDFAVLKLEENESNIHPPPGLLQLHFPSPPNGPIFIIGHPNGRIKSTNICLVVSLFDRGNEFSDHLHKRQNTECSNFVCGYGQKKTCIHMYNPDFEKHRSNPNVVTYNTCFFEGSSGSPVFNKNGELVALHAVGFGYKMGNKDCSIIECGYSIHSIILKIKSKFKSWYDAIIGPDAREASSHVDALLHEAEDEMDCS
ncbi:serine protease FAM111A [Pituophis catenifer annectens]|uniref:serine protease FAM111A n=1 Tax=Pituophis catenifer annectens TaxID=94852 RepID=UPI003994D9EA